MTEQEIANHLSLVWANRHIRPITWLELLALHKDILLNEFLTYEYK